MDPNQASRFGLYLCPFLPGSRCFLLLICKVHITKHLPYKCCRELTWTKFLEQYLACTTDSVSGRYYFGKQGGNSDCSLQESFHSPLKWVFVYGGGICCLYIHFKKIRSGIAGARKLIICLFCFLLNFCCYLFCPRYRFDGFFSAELVQSWPCQFTWIWEELKDYFF